MARPKNQTEIKEKLYTLKLGSIQVPYVEEGQGKWKTVTQAQWDLKNQAAIFDYWRNVLFSEVNDDDKKAKLISGKMDKLFIVEKEELVEA